MNRKGQGALEYLLLIGGAILVAIVVITILNSLGAPAGANTNLNAARVICAARPIIPITACEGGDATNTVGQDSNVGTGATRASCTCISNAATNSCESEACCTGADCDPV